jgi:hypothetical protein
MSVTCTVELLVKQDTDCKSIANCAKVANVAKYLPSSVSLCFVQESKDEPCSLGHQPKGLSPSA